MTEKRPRNIHEIINRFDTKFGHPHISVKVIDVAMNHVFLQVTYKKDHAIDPATAWGVCKDNESRSVADLCAMVTLQLDQPEGSDRPRFILWRDGMHVNSYTMPEAAMARQFQNTVEDMSRCLAEKLLSHEEVTLGRMLHRQAIQECRNKLERLTRVANGFAATGKIESYALLSNTQEEQFRELMREIHGLHRIGRYLLFQTDGNGRYIENGKPMKGVAAA